MAFDQKTPYYFTLVDRKDSDDSTAITYQAETEEGRLIKTFTVYKHTYQIDLELKAMPKKDDVPMGNLRIFFPSPLMPEIEKTDIISAIRGYPIKETARTRVNVNEGWLTPTLFGTESRYFVHSMVKDPQAFCQRAYYKLYDSNRMRSILEGPAVTKEASWRVSFYFGPKELSALIAVDPQLETLEYSGFWGPVDKGFMELLQWLYKYLHNYGWAIVVIAILIKLLLLPMTLKAEAGAKKNVEIKKKLEYIKHRYKDDPERSKQEQAELIAKHGMPGLSGCLPLLLQLPIFWALSRVAGSIELYRAPFLWIPDLAAKDPWYILPILTTFSMLAMMRSTADSKQQLTSIAMALIFGAISTSFSAGLALYIFVGTFLGVVQSIYSKTLCIG